MNEDRLAALAMKEKEKKRQIDRQGEIQGEMARKGEGSRTPRERRGESMQE